MQLLLPAADDVDLAVDLVAPCSSGPRAVRGLAAAPRTLSLELPDVWSRKRINDQLAMRWAQQTVLRLG